MIEISPEILTLIMFGGILLGVLIGYPVAIALGALTLIIGFLLSGPSILGLIYGRMFSLIRSFPILAVPLFVFMGTMLERSGMAAKMYDVLYLWLGELKGGLAIVTVVLGTILAACVGVIGASVSMLSFFALPAMIKRGYDKSLASGTVCASGTLGILIPPSVMLVIYGPMANISVGKLFIAAVFPGLLLSALYCIYIALRCFIQPELAPPIPAEERAAVPFIKKTSMLATSLLPPVILVLAVLGSIFSGLAPPTEAAAVGAIAATLLTFAYRRFSWRVLNEVSLETAKVTAMIMLIGGFAFAFVGVFLGEGGGKVVEGVILNAPLGRWGSFSMVMFIVFILGFFIDWTGIIFIIVPVVAPLAPVLGFDPLWFAMMICVNFQMGFLTPPFAPAIFYLRGCVAPELGITMSDIIKGVWPFVFLIIVGLALCVAFPEIILWLPAQMIR